MGYKCFFLLFKLSILLHIIRQMTSRNKINLKLLKPRKKRTISLYWLYFTVSFISFSISLMSFQWWQLFSRLIFISNTGLLISWETLSFSCRMVYICFCTTFWIVFFATGSMSFLDALVLDVSHRKAFIIRIALEMFLISIFTMIGL